MPKPPALERADAAAPAAPAIATATLVRNNLIRTLGQPGDLLRVQVRLLWDDFYRANVFVGDASNSRVAHSYFLRATADGKIVTSTPAIRRAY